MYCHMHLIYRHTLHQQIKVSIIKKKYFATWYKYVFLNYVLLLKYMIMILDQPLVVKNKERVKRTLGIIVPDSYYSRTEEKDLPVDLSIVTQSRYENELSIVLPIIVYI